MSSRQLSLFRPRLWGRENHYPPWSLDARTATRLVLCIAVLSLVGWLYLAQASQIATTESHARQVVDEIEKLERENAQLRYQIARLETIPRVEAKASQLGLGLMHQETTYLTVSETPWEQEIAPGNSTDSVPTNGKIHTAVAEPKSEFTFPSILELWNEVKAQFEAWMGQ